MGKILLINGSPRAPRSNSKRYAALFDTCCPVETDYYNLNKNNHQTLIDAMATYTDVVFIFPLYADGIPVTLLHFLKALEAQPPEIKPVVSVLINCGFLEYEQNDIAVRMMQLFCAQNGYDFGSVLRIGSGEAILDTPFQIRRHPRHETLRRLHCRLAVWQLPGENAAAQAAVHPRLHPILGSLWPQKWPHQKRHADHDHRRALLKTHMQHQ